MKNTIKIIGLLLIINILSSCEKETESIKIQKPFEQSPEYYENLRAYKKSDHQLAVGWFYHWGGQGAGRAGYLSSVPDSVDIILIGWGEWTNLTQAKIEDMRYVQQKFGTKVCISHLIQNLSTEQDEWGWVEGDEVAIETAIKKYANALCDSVMKYNFDGFDMDYEPNFGGHGNLASYPNRMAILVKEMGKRLGNQSETGKMFILDGEGMHLSVAEETYPYFDIFISQAYGTTSPSSLQNRYNELKERGFKPEQFVVVESFESNLWETGGANYSDPKYGTIPSLLGMAYWNPIEGRKGGAGVFRMENEYNNPETDYKYLRKAIQIMNPSIK